MSGINQLVRQLQSQRARAEQEIEKLNLAIKALTSFGRLGTSRMKLRRKPKFSAAGIARIRAAQKARWAKIRAAQRK